MSLRIIVCVKQVIDPETPMSAFHIEPGVQAGHSRARYSAGGQRLRRTRGRGGAVYQGHRRRHGNCDLCGHRLRDGRDERSPLPWAPTNSSWWMTSPSRDLDAFCTAYALSEAIKKVGDFDLILCGRQASDWDNAHVPMGVAEDAGPSVPHDGAEDRGGGRWADRPAVSDRRV